MSSFDNAFVLITRPQLELRPVTNQWARPGLQTTTMSGKWAKFVHEYDDHDPRGRRIAPVRTEVFCVQDIAEDDGQSYNQILPIPYPPYEDVRKERDRTRVDPTPAAQGSRREPAEAVGRGSSPTKVSFEGQCPQGRRLSCLIDWKSPRSSALLHRPVPKVIESYTGTVKLSTSSVPTM